MRPSRLSFAGRSPEAKPTAAIYQLAQASVYKKLLPKVSRC
jgi:hypothetical protein